MVRGASPAATSFKTSTRIPPRPQSTTCPKGGSKILDGVRGQAGINKEIFAGMLVRLSTILEYTGEIAEIDLNPILGKGSDLVVVDARIRVQKKVI